MFLVIFFGILSILSGTVAVMIVQERIDALDVRIKRLERSR